MLEKIQNIVFSMKTTLVLLLLFAFSIAMATFIEERYDTEAARALVYNSKWLEILMLMMIINFAGNIWKYKLLTLKKAPIFLIHLGFIVAIIGAAITRYFGFEGIMHIRQGESSDMIFSSSPYFIVSYNLGDVNYYNSSAVYAGQVDRNSFNMNIKTIDNETIKLRYNGYIRNAIEKIDENVRDGSDILQFSVLADNSTEKIYLKNKESRTIDKVNYAFNNDLKDAVVFFEVNDKLFIKSPASLVLMDMMGNNIDSIPSDSLSELKPDFVYNAYGQYFVVKKLFKKAAITYTEGNPEQKGIDALIVNMEYKGDSRDVFVTGGPGYFADLKDLNLFVSSPTKSPLSIKGLSLAYGDKPIKLPFSIYLKKFILERYPGSMSPSSYESRVILIDKRNNLNLEKRIYMNNVLNYDGFRFFQSSYDKDERGTILSVNHDFIGTWVTYFGYFILGLGFISTLFSPNSRFFELRNNIKQIRLHRKSSQSHLHSVAFISLIISFLSFASFPLLAADFKNPVSASHADKFAQLLVQSYDGRFQPVHTLANDVMHKISRKDRFSVPQKGNMNAVQVLMDMFMDVPFWKQQKIIYVREKSVRDILGITGKHAAFNDLFDSNSNYKLAEYIESAFRKKQGAQSRFDKEIIKLDERVNICMQVFRGSMLTIFPLQNSSNHKWIAWNDSLAHMPITGPLKIINQQLNLRNFNYSNLFGSYFVELINSVDNGDYTKPEKILGYIHSIQQQIAAPGILPSSAKVNSEIIYNKLKIFENLRNIYAIIAIPFLLLAFIDNLLIKRNKIIKFIINVLIIALAAAGFYHTFGMAMRWYITDHAPWSNGYEALILVAWGGLLAGFSFIRYSKITLAATALLAFSILMTAGHSSYDPQLTNLQPVLKSYWLIIHVAAITISYGFLMLGFLLGIINLFIYLFKNTKNHQRLDLLIKELSHINEMNLIIGLVLATAGTFLGAIWANESWGRYWGWDAKETWALIIIITYSVILHLRLVPKLRNYYIFNVFSIIGFASVLMTFIGVNYYLSKGLHSYAAGDTPVFPVWAWLMIASLFALIFAAGIKHYTNNSQNINNFNS